jgi:hypothetical protein
VIPGFVVSRQDKLIQTRKQSIIPVADRPNQAECVPEGRPVKGRDRVRDCHLAYPVTVLLGEPLQPLPKQDIVARQLLFIDPFARPEAAGEEVMDQHVGSAIGVCGGQLAQAGERPLDQPCHRPPEIGFEGQPVEHVQFRRIGADQPVAHLTHTGVVTHSAAPVRLVR